jgi:transcription-repair coupling factor (superfamily II helicase)
MLPTLLDKVRTSQKVRAFLQTIHQPKHWSIEGLIGSSDAVVARLAAEALLEKRKHVLFLVADFSAYSHVFDDVTALSQGHSNYELLGYPEEELSPYDVREQNPIVVSERQECLEKLLSGAPAIVITTVRAITKKIPLPESLRAYRIELKRDQNFSFSYLTELLYDMKFEKQEVVDQAGTYAVRGGIVDVYPYSMEHPIRIEFLGETIESIRSFDVMSQRSIEGLEQVTLYPKSNSEEATGCLTDYLSSGTTVFQFEPDIVRSSSEKYHEEIEIGYRKKENEVSTGSLYFSSGEIMDKISTFQQVHFCRMSKRQFDTITFQTQGIESFNGHVNLLREKLGTVRDRYRSYILCNNSGQVERLEELLDSEKLQADVDYSAGVGELHEGFYWDDADLAVFTDHQIFGRIKRPRVYRKFKSAQALRHIHSLKPGDFVVHVDHGIAKYTGLEKVTSGEHTEECLKLLYQNGDKLFVPLEHFMRVQKFSAEEGVEPRLNKLGAPDWERLKARTRKSIKDIAQDLIKLYAERKSKKGFAFTEDSHLQYELEASFEFEDTPDQSKVTAEIKKDMESEMPMDRLMCGDVGYGKTEVAVRASFKAVQDSKQVVVLVPTTILAEQHFETFSARFKEFPVRVDVLSRFKTPKEQKAILEKLKNGEIDILIGTHRLLSKDVVFRDLGLLVIDEEQRFGVSHKERLRQMKSTVDTLTLTATPIPRTLHFSLMGGRDLSVINTPPQDRLPIKTEITHFDEDLIHDAVMKELDRGGQVYYVHNRVQSIERVTETLRTIVPKARLAIVHGQMPPKRVEDVVHAFMQRKFDILVATTIIENGIDIPNVNTIIVDNAHQFGLSQLYQLRGRVGRSSHQAYCYLLTMPFSSMPTDALKRLQAIEEFTELGSGFLIAMRDLEIRGAGNLLGSEQSGYVNAVGFELYCQILEEAVLETKRENNIPVPSLAELGIKEKVVETHIEVFCDTYIPDYYVNVQAERVRVYKELSEIKSADQIAEIEKELLDRFGVLPEEVQNLLKSLEIKFYAARFGFDRVVIDENKFTLRLHSDLVRDRGASEQMRNKINWVLSASPNIRLVQEKGNVDIRVGFPWFDVQKNKARPEGKTLTDWQTLERVSEFVRDLWMRDQEGQSGNNFQKENVIMSVSI